MSNTDFDIIFKKLCELAETIAVEQENENILPQFQIYSNFITQFLQILDNPDKCPDYADSKINELIIKHGMVLDRLKKAKAEIGDKITSRIRKEHIQQKYFSESLKAALLSKKA